MRMLKPALVYGAVFLVLAGLAGIFSSKTDPAFTPQTQSTRLELMAEDSAELPRLHHYDADGIETHVDLRWKEGETGKLTRNPHGQLSEAEFRFANGSVRKLMRFAPDGKTLIHGFELSEKKEKIWETESSNRNSFISTKVYWSGGTQKYAEVEDNRSQGLRTTKYYRRDGTLWVWKLEKIGGPLVSEKSYYESGTVRSALTSNTGSTEVDFFREDGTLEFRQIYESYDMDGSDSEGQTIQTTARFLRKVLLIDETGNTVIRDLTLSSGMKRFIETELKANDDGTRSRFTLNEDGIVLNARRLDGKNRVIGVQAESKGELHKYEDRLLEQPGETSKQAVKQWLYAERLAGR